MSSSHVRTRDTDSYIIERGHYGWMAYVGGDTQLPVIISCILIIIYLFFKHREDVPDN